MLIACGQLILQSDPYKYIDFNGLVRCSALGMLAAPFYRCGPNGGLLLS